MLKLSSIVCIYHSPDDSTLRSQFIVWVLVFILFITGVICVVIIACVCRFCVISACLQVYSLSWIALSSCRFDSVCTSLDHCLWTWINSLVKPFGYCSPIEDCSCLLEYSCLAFYTCLPFVRPCLFWPFLLIKACIWICTRLVGGRRLD